MRWNEWMDADETHIHLLFVCLLHTLWIASTKTHSPDAHTHTHSSQSIFDFSLFHLPSPSLFPSIGICGTKFATISNMSINKLCFPFIIYIRKTENSRFFPLARPMFTYRTHAQSNQTDKTTRRSCLYQLEVHSGGQKQLEIFRIAHSASLFLYSSLCVCRPLSVFCSDITLNVWNSIKMNTKEENFRFLLGIKYELYILANRNWCESVCTIKVLWNSQQFNASGWFGDSQSDFHSFWYESHLNTLAN